MKGGADMAGHKKIIETIRTEDGRLRNLSLHEERLNRSRRELYHARDIISLKEIEVPKAYHQGVFKCRVVASNRGIELIEFIPYTRRLVRSLQLVESGIDYSYKYEDRSELDQLWTLRRECDNILIVKNGLLTDTTFANIAFFDGARWVTPAAPLLEGTRRARLLDEGRMVAEELRPADIALFKLASPINAMLDLDEIIIPVEKIIGL